MKKISLFLVIILTIIFIINFRFPHSFAQSTNEAEFVESDYLLDIKKGEEQIANDEQAQVAKKEIEQNEDTDASISTSTETLLIEEPKQTVDQKDEGLETVEQLNPTVEPTENVNNQNDQNGNYSTENIEKSSEAPPSQDKDN